MATCSHHPRSHSRFVLAVARRLRSQLPVGLPWAEFLQEGELALVLARRDFDPDRGTKFSTFALGRIRGHLIQVMREVRRSSRVVSLAGPVADQSSNAEAEATADLVWDLVDRLDVQSREAVIRRWGLDGWGEECQRTTALSMGMSPQKISDLVRRSLRSMRDQLAGDVA